MRRRRMKGLRLISFRRRRMRMRRRWMMRSRSLLRVRISVLLARNCFSRSTLF
jgi:hypothetical protein